jgi:hypothetical protein
MGGRSAIQDKNNYDSDSENEKLTYLQRRKLKKIKSEKEKPIDPQALEPAVTLRPFRDLMNAMPSYCVRREEEFIYYIIYINPRPPVHVILSSKNNN